MMPMRPSNDSVERRLAHQRDLLTELTGLHIESAEQLRSEAVVRAATERMIQALVDLAIDINSHIASSVLGRAPATGRESFDLLAESGVITVELAQRLKPSVGLRNVLVHLYADIDVEIVADSVAEILEHYGEYVRAVARWMMRVSS